MNIVILDGTPMNPGDLSWDALAQLGALTVHERTAPEEVAPRLQNAEVVFTNKVKLTRAHFESAPQLKFIGETATGTDNIDLIAAREHGITVCNVPGYSSDFTAQTTFALILELTHHAGEHSRLVHDGDWSRAEAFSFWRYPLMQLAGKTLLIVGLGTIGGKVARIGAAFGMRVLAAQLPGRESPLYPSSHDEFLRLPLDETLAEADVVSLHCPLTPTTRELINAERLEHFKRGALLINAGRGPLIKENAVRTALEWGQLGGYGADVMSLEPPPPDNPLFGAPNCVLTPHLGWASPEARQTLLSECVENLRAFLQGTARNRVA